MRIAAGLLDGHDLVEDLHVRTRQERPAVDHHVDLVRSGSDGFLGVHELDVERRPSGRERGRHRGHVHAIAHHLAGHTHEVPVHADRGHAGRGGIGRIGPKGLAAEGPDLAGGVRPLEGRQVDHADRQVDRVGLRLVLDRPGAEARRARLRPHLVDAGEAVQEAAQRPCAEVRQNVRREGGSHLPTVAIGRLRPTWLAAGDRPPRARSGGRRPPARRPAGSTSPSARSRSGAQ